MNIHTTTDRWVARLAGAIAAGSAIYVLTQDAIKSGHWTTDDLLMPVLVLLTILGIHLAGSAVKSRSFGSALGFVGLGIMGIALIVYTSVGRQARIADAEDAGVAYHAARVAELQAGVSAIEAERKAAYDMLVDANRRLEIDCVRGKKSKGHCDGIRASIGVYTGSVAGHDARIERIQKQVAEMGPPPATGGSRATRMAAVIAVFSADEEAAKARLSRVFRLFEPFAYSLFWELGALVAFGYGFGGKRRRPTFADSAQSSFAGTADPAMFAGKFPDPTPPRGPKKRQPLPANVADLRTFASKRIGKRSHSEVERQALLDALAQGPANNETLAKRMGVKGCEATRRRQAFPADVIERRDGKNVIIELRRKETA